jgi:hypothetical protein
MKILIEETHKQDAGRVKYIPTFLIVIIKKCLVFSRNKSRKIELSSHSRLGFSNSLSSLRYPIGITVLYHISARPY